MHMHNDIKLSNIDIFVRIHEILRQSHSHADTQ